VDNDLDTEVDEGYADSDVDGSADCVDLDDDNDGTTDVDETTCGSDSLNSASTCEVCDGVDNDLDTEVDEGFADSDVDGSADCVDLDDDNDGTTDVDETTCGSDPLNSASTCEVCDGVDNDLDTEVDEGFPDSDVDGSADCVDLDDDNDGTSDVDETTCGSDPLNSASTCELCDGVDNDLDTEVDEGYADTDVDGSADCVDLDDDNDGTSDVDETSCGSDPLDSLSTCEVCDGVDNDLDTEVDEGFPDSDVDGSADCVDLDDDNDGTTDVDETTCGSDPLNILSTCEVCDGVDNDLDTEVDEGFTDTDADDSADCVDNDDDNDGTSDVDETLCGSDPLNAASTCISVSYVDINATGLGDGSSWDNAFNSLQDALDLVVSGDQIWVATGIYTPDQGMNVTPADPNATFQLKNGVELYGGFAGNETVISQRDSLINITVLSGDLNGDDEINFINNDENSYVVVTGSYTDDTALIDGFTIRSGNGVEGSGMYINSGGLTVSNCIFTNNFSSNYGGAINLVNSNNTVIADSVISNNETGWGGGGISIRDSNNITIYNCSFSYNKSADLGGGLETLYSSVTVSDSVFINNIAVFGGGVSGGAGSLDFINSIFSNNKASWGGGAVVVAGGSLLSITNCSIVNNYSGGSFAGGGAIDSWGTSSLTVTDSIIWGNTAEWLGQQLYAKGESLISIDYSDVEGGEVGIILEGTSAITSYSNNFDVDPLLDSDLHLTGNSPCRDAGNPVSTLLIDIDGEGRPQGGASDIGADEYLDSDLDDIPDYWELYWFGNLDQDMITDWDNDGVVDREDRDPVNSYVCGDLDMDTCDDCSVTGADQSGGDTLNDGQDSNTDGICDGYEDDDDNDSISNVDEITCGSDPLNNLSTCEVCDGVDNDLDLQEDEGFADTDLDWIADCVDTDDDNDMLDDVDELACGSDPLVWYSTCEVCDGVDNDLNDGIDEDFDLDGDGFISCQDDCNDDDVTIYPGACEIKHDGIDQDCNGYDLTIDILSADYKAKKDDYNVIATSADWELFTLELDGFGPMIWSFQKSYWIITVNPGYDPGLVPVTGIEGSTADECVVAP
jgi:hypothetical protein